jgi:hypothetical protein
MSIINNLLGSDSGELLIKGMSSQIGQSKSQTNHLMSMAIPVLLKAMQRNSNSKEGASGLLSAISNKHDGSILNKLENIFTGTESNDLEKDGEKILGHVLGQRQQNIQNALSIQSGIDNTSVSRVLKMAAPVVMGLLGKQQNEQNALNPDENGISNILMNLVGAASENNNQSFFESILDADNDGSIIDDVAEVISGKKKSGIAGIFGKLFNKN